MRDPKRRVSPDRRSQTTGLFSLASALRGTVLAFVVAGYALLASASAAGHGWWLIQHDATAHHEADHDATHWHDEAARHDETHADADHHGSADTHDVDCHDAEHPGTDATTHHAAAGDHDHDQGSAVEDHDAPDAVSTHQAHAHDGHVHTHDGPTEPPPAFVVSGIGKHVLPVAPRLVPPVRRGERIAGMVFVPVDEDLAVEAPPPRRAA